ncbi:MAG: RidA family protein [Sphingomonas adhaesiva]|uniref:RidA family protein n=1 Tax=Sphingomonas adhaesiva TaxID=28212 RepID=UPI002FFB5E57
MTSSALVLLTLLAAPVAAQTRPPVEHIARPGSRAPFSPAVRAGDTIYLSGQIGALPDGTIPKGMDAQARAAMTNLGDAARMAGVGFDDMVKCTVMLADMSQWAAFNAVYVTYFAPGRLPARSAFGVNGLAMGAGVEIECIAIAPSRR